MAKSLPVAPKNRLLPFHDPAFSWGDFEAFFTDFLRLQPQVAVIREGKRLVGRVVSAKRYETSGDKQNGIDIRADVEVKLKNGTSKIEEWAFQCKHRRYWSPNDTSKSFDKAENEFPSAKHYFLLLTCNASRRVREIEQANKKWSVWSCEEITGEICKLPSKDEAARIINTYFGPYWADEILGLPGDGPLMASGAYFARQMEPSTLHHHRATLVGRKTELESCRCFLEDKDKRLFLLPGAGGSGKSRLLKALADSFSPAQRRRFSVRFFENTGTPLSSKDVAALEGQPVIVIDDAHREEIEPLLRVLLRSGRAKVILATRPQGLPVLRQAASAANVDPSGLMKKPS